ncbi:MAG: NifB/NifX family molybdenum-iron cluster-binding protein [Theionarchaea archaeon]|nr:NifB/NifX family molybdenum-iron cluster-binding protein [Theionarchaea archaeon]MBU7000371.1 NifB/NifX family molybdenum-iron cluster-binding protein [Theionarchaea archaeon]MBU7021213.1 NifB/NifX family molybdenum-iron cluster-binding protein [Theionarchaea archaeon]
MKIGIPTMGKKGLAEEVSPHFGRAPTFTLYDTESKSVQVVENTSEHMGGSGKPPEELALHNAEVMLCSGLGPRAVHMFESYGIRVFVGATGTVQDAIDLFTEGILQEATDENACKMHRH